MKSIRERGESLIMRTEFAHQFCSCANLPIVLMGFFDTSTRTFSERWIGRLESLSDENSQDLVRKSEVRLATWSAVTCENNNQSQKLHDNSNDTIIWMNLGEYVLGVGAAIDGIHPVIASPHPKVNNTAQHQTIMQMGMAYVSQQMMQGLFDHSAWMGSLVESALQVLSIHFLAITQDGQIRFDSLRTRRHDAASSDWLMRKKLLSLLSEGGNSELKNALLAAVSPNPQSSIASVFVSPDTARLVAVTPLSGNDTKTALVLFESEHTDHFRLREHFFDAYKLTPSESLISHDILSGRSIAESAEANNLSQATVRSYMKQVFAKTGTHRQSGFVSLYFSSILPITIDLKATPQALSLSD